MHADLRHLFTFRKTFLFSTYILSRSFIELLNKIIKNILTLLLVRILSFLFIKRWVVPPHYTSCHGDRLGAGLLMGQQQPVNVSLCLIRSESSALILHSTLKTKDSSKRRKFIFWQQLFSGINACVKEN